MKKNLLLLCAMLFSQFLFAQKWFWGAEGLQNSDTYGVAADTNGNVFLAGGFYDTISFDNSGTHSLSSYNEDTYLVKFDSSGNILWVRQSKVASSAGECCAIMVATDVSGNIFVTGFFKDTVSFGAYTLRSTTKYGDVFLVKYDAGGNVLWAKQSLGASYNDLAEGYSVTTDVNGNAYITGFFGRNVSFGTFSLISSNRDAFIVKYDANGNELWANQSVVSSLTSGGYGTSLTVDAIGNVCVTGRFIDTVSFGPSILKSAVSAGDMFLAKFDINGNPLWAVQSNAASYNKFNSVSVGNSVITDKANNIYVTGYFSDSAYFNTYLLSTGSVYPNRDAFLCKYDTKGNLLWAEQSYAPNNIYMQWSGYSLAIDKDNHIYFSGGGGTGTNYFALSKDTLYTNAASDASVVMILDTAGYALCGAAISTGGDDNNTIACTPSGKYIYLGGDIADTITFGVNLLSNNSEQPFVARWSSCSCLLNVDNIVSRKDTICMGDTLTLTAFAHGGHNVFYNWSPGGQTSQSIHIKPASSNWYMVTAYDSITKCSAENAIWITVENWPTPSVSPNSSVCLGSSIVLTASGGENYTWSNGSTVSSISVFPASNTTYTVTIANGPCAVVDSVNITVKDAPAFSACCNHTIFQGDSVMLSAGGGTSYLWVPSAGLSCDTCPNTMASPSVNTTYSVTVTNSDGCSSTGDLTVSVECGGFFVPTAFSPNNDGKNDLLLIKGDCFKSFDFTIYDRWGNKMFETEDRNIGWDGNYHNQPMNAGTYIYYLIGNLKDGTALEKKGTISLVR